LLVSTGFRVWPVRGVRAEFLTSRPNCRALFLRATLTMEESLLV
jgi:hypothetical protein